MDQPIIDTNKSKDELYYPPLDSSFNPDLTLVQEDDYFSNSNDKNCCFCERSKIIRTDPNSFTLYETNIWKIFTLFFLFIFVIIAFIAFILCIFIYYIIYLLILIVSLVFIILMLFFDCYFASNSYLRLEPNSISLIKAGVFKKYKTVYKNEEL